MNRRSIRIAALLLAIVGGGQAAQAGYIHAKATLAQALIHRAWMKALNGESAAKPWPWADTAPVARLGVPSLRIDLMVLEGATGRTLAFGPGHVSGTAKPGQRGNVAIGGHRDTHFQFLKDLKLNDRILVESAKGDVLEYEVASLVVVDKGAREVLGDFGDDRLTLITCYPFDAIQPGGPERFVVIARRCDALGNIDACRPEEM